MRRVSGWRVKGYQGAWGFQCSGFRVFSVQDCRYGV